MKLHGPLRWMKRAVMRCEEKREGLKKKRFFQEYSANKKGRGFFMSVTYLT
jgi:hypothetical protein